MRSAALLAREAKGLLIGDDADPAFVDARAEITSVNHVRTIHTAPDSILVAISADFQDSLLMGEAEILIEAIETELKAAIRGGRLIRRPASLIYAAGTSSTTSTIDSYFGQGSTSLQRLSPIRSI